MQEIQFGTTLYVGDESLKRLSDFRNEKILIVTDSFIASSELLSHIKSYIDSGNETMVFSEVIPDPPIDNIVAGLESSKDFSATILLAIGGGSAIDAAKAMLYFGKLTDRFHGIRFVTIPTTSGTGSEVTNFSIITDKEKGTKYPLITDQILPDEAILDSGLVAGLPPKQTADTGIDVLTHAIEAYVSTSANDISDALSEKAIRCVFTYLERAYKDGKDKVAREKMHMASTMAGMAFNTASLGLNHGIAHAAGARWHIPHGRINGILLPNVIRYNAGIMEGDYRKNTSPAAKRYAEIAKFLGLNAGNAQMGVRSLVNAILALEKSLSIPKSLSEWGVNKEQFESDKNVIAEAALADRCTATNPIVPTKEDIIRVLGKSFK
ncbi:1-propanol dehydrogenase PduQ [Lacrimispora saccharolytica]|uniref:Iron-containing alcohol dehydrogenase n=1 Tax=Lacrimispora saccharolytica (strain ATCC 35040 / DSM 2544 / NRCC 2533 / WM1) TaxID=610130 RepID=D9R9P1_LACSW|nr:1-propanol dehydrogenase PduQ [Lacrimispora saccharolytica]ADL04091.1 iron-containing alcohol dehydrogenase [[Clostridium] saccharolyticum WM1]QRV21615.1 iron-containing alcohol dehydrogenase [Lacrimispora saccharolytica]